MAQIEADYVNFTIVEHIGKICYYIVNALSRNKLLCRLYNRLAVAERVAVTIEYFYTHLCHFGVFFKQIFLCKKCVLICL